MKNVYRSLFALALALTGATAVHAQVVFDFESAPATYVASTSTALRPGIFTGLALTNGALTIVISRQNSDRFDIVDNTATYQAGKPTTWGNRSVDPFFDYNATNTVANNGFITNFSQGVSGFSMEFGDYGIPDIDVLTLNAYSGLNGTGTLLATTTVTQTIAFTGFNTASVAAAGIQSVTWSSTSPENYYNSLFYDNFRVSVVPEPSTLVFVGGAGIVVGALALRRHRSA